MRAPKPQPPVNFPAGTIQVGGPIEWFSISLGVKGAELAPEEVTAILGRRPDSAQRRGEPLFRPDGTLMRIPTFGAWWVRLKREDTDEWDCSAALEDLLATMNREVEAWRRLGTKYELAVRVGLALPFSGAGFELSAPALSYLGERGISVGFEVYTDDAERANKAPEPTPVSVMPRAIEGDSE